MQGEKDNEDILLNEMDLTNNILFLNESSMNMKAKPKMLRFIIICEKEIKLNENLSISQVMHTFEDNYNESIELHTSAIICSPKEKAKKGHELIKQQQHSKA